MRLKDYDILSAHILDLNEQGWDIRRVDYKLIDNVMYSMPTIDVVPKQNIDAAIAEIKKLQTYVFYSGDEKKVDLPEVLAILERIKDDQQRDYTRA